MRALVVGASAGVGRAIAAELAGRGAALVVAARSHEALDDLARELRDRHDVEVTVLPLDLTGPDAELRAFLDEATAVLGRIDVAILTAGRSTTTTTASATGSEPRIWSPSTSSPP